MAYDPKDFVVTVDYSSGVHLYGENKSSIGINDVYVHYQDSYKDGTVRNKSYQRTQDISPGEKREILTGYISADHKLMIKAISVTASDGTKVQVQPPQIADKRCFVTTAAYGDPNHPIVESFRSLRDEVLVNHKVGKSVIGWYNHKGPELAAMIENRPMFRTAARMVLTPLAITISTIRGGTALLRNNINNAGPK